MKNENPKVKITNRLSFDVDIYDVFNPSKGGVQEAYKYTKLSAIASGQTAEVQTIRPVSQLQAMYTETIEKLNKAYYYQFPIKIMPVVQFTFDDSPPLEFSIEQSDEDAMIQSFLFHRFAMANPNSALTKNLYSALKKGSADDINTFFQNTKNFKSCTLSSWNAVMAWLQMFTSGWRGPYYLYEQAPNPAPSGYVPVLVATLNIASTPKENKATLQMCGADSKGNPVYASPPQTSNIVMNGDGTMGDDNPGQDVSVSLTPVWMNVTQTTMKDGAPVSSHLIGSSVTGTVANKTVVSSQTARQIPGKKLDKKKASSFDAIFGKICQVIGFLVGLIMIGEIGLRLFKSKTSKTKEAKEKAKSEKDFAEKEKTIDAAPDQDVVKKVTDSESKVASDSESVSKEYSDTSEALQKDAMTKTMEDTASKIQEEMISQIKEGYTPTQPYEDAMHEMQQSFSEIKKDISDGKFTDAGAKLSDVSKSMEQTLRENGDKMHDWEKKSLEESSRAVEDAASESEALEDAQSEYEDDMNNTEEDSGYESETKWPETDEIPLEI